MENVLITGGTGLIGSALTVLLEKEGYNVRILSRNPMAKNQFKWNLKDQYIDDKAFENLHHIIHLAGAGIADKRWTPKRKQVIIDSRVDSAELLFSKTESSQIDLKTFVSASGIGYYGAVTSDHIFIETDEAENDFLGQVCKVWEEAALQFESINIPTTILRTGIVLSANGGAIEKMKTPIVSPLGSGHQYMPWIHIDDLCQLYLSAIQGKIKGIYNAVAPEYQTNKSFSKKLSKSLGRPYIPFGVPAFGLKTIFGELAIILLTGSRISCEKLINDGFEFKYPKLSEAFENLFKK
ncbi:MAG: TIGR01777 family oxidoreductase [Polaribacter sp.]|jgi:uncharacterized protein (TIGR01777 family)